MNTYVLDTSAFTNSASYKKFGANTLAALENFLNMDGTFYMTPECWDELIGFVCQKDLENVVKQKVIIRSPSRLNTNVPTELLFEYVVETRKRADQTLKFATGVLRDAYKTVTEVKVHGKPDPETPFVARLKDGVRHHMREGFIDSAADINTLLLARELPGILVTSDKGLARWADRFGIDRLPI